MTRKKEAQMKKVLVLALVGAIMCSGLSLQPPTAADQSPSVGAPEYSKLDKDLVDELKANGVKIAPQKNAFMNGKAHFKPVSGLTSLNPIDMTGKNNKGIAILVDFPVGDKNKSAVPGVNYDPVPQEYFDTLLNGDEFKPFKPYDLDMFKWITADMAPADIPLTQSMKEYYKEVSYDQYGIDVEVIDWVTLPNPYNYYMGQDGYAISNENGDAMMWELIRDAIEKADPHVDFSQYAKKAEKGEFWLQQEKDQILKGLVTDGTSYQHNGTSITEYVPNVFIIHRGTGAEFSGDPEIIWSHKWDIASSQYWSQYYKTGTEYTDKEYAETVNYVVADGVVVNTYNIVPEVGQDISGYLRKAYPDTFPPTYTGRKPSPAYPGVYAHEFGHVLGLPDQYDYGYDSEGTGIFTLMAGGSYGRSVNNTENKRWFTGNSPVHMDAWSKYYLGFAKPTVITKNTTVTLNPVTTANPATNQPDIFKVVVPGSDGREYFLLENRQQSGFDKGLLINGDIHGLVVYHVVDDLLIQNFHRPNEAANPTPNHRTNKYQDKETSASHYAISVLQADGSYDMETGLNDGDASDTFPGKNGIKALLNNGKQLNTNSLKMWQSGTNDTGISIINIVEKDGIITCDIIFK